MTVGQDHARFLDQAIAYAVQGVEQEGDGPFGALVVQDGRVLARGRNRVTAQADPTAHAEIVAIRLACQVVGSHNLAPAVLYSSCEPCPMCLSAIHWARLERVYFAADRQDAARAGFDDELLYRRFRGEKAEGPGLTRIAVDSAQAPFQAWAATENKRTY